MMDPIGAHEYAAPRLLLGGEKQGELSVEVGGLAPEKGAQHKPWIILEGLPQPSVRMGPWSGAEQTFEPVFHRGTGMLE